MLRRSARALFALACLIVSSSAALAADPNRNLLRPFDADGLPVVNRWQGPVGCYVACYAHHAGVYDVGEFGVHGLVRVPGRYPVSEASNWVEDRICRPRGHEYDDISAMRMFKDLCNAAIPSCDGQCWAGGDTGGFFDRASYVPKPAGRVAVVPRGSNHPFLTPVRPPRALAWRD